MVAKLKPTLENSITYYQLITATCYPKSQFSDVFKPSFFPLKSRFFQKIPRHFFEICQSLNSPSGHACPDSSGSPRTEASKAGSQRPRPVSSPAGTHLQDTHSQFSPKKSPSLRLQNYFITGACAAVRQYTEKGSFNFSLFNGKTTGFYPGYYPG
jgi:hypothetical protein